MKSKNASTYEVLFVSSLAQSSLNVHILEAVHKALNVHPAISTAAFRPPQSVPQSTDLGRFDLMIYLGSAISDIVPHNLISKTARKFGVPSVYWATDDPYEFDFRYRAALYDIYISNDENSRDSFLERDNVYALPLAAPSSDEREVVPLNERAKGMFFCGYPYANRKMIVDDILQHSEISRSDLIVSGPNWSEKRINVIKSPSSHNKLIDIYAGSEFVLNMGRTFSLANEHYNLIANTPGPRTFECALAGTPQLFFGNVTEIEDFFLPDEEILVCETVDDVARHIKNLRTNRDRWNAIAQSSQARARRDHLYTNRVGDLIKILDRSGVLSLGKKAGNFRSKAPA